MRIVKFLPSKKFFFVLFILLWCIYGHTQKQPSQMTNKSPFWSQVRFGGGLGLGFTNGGFNASVSPSAIYQFNDQFASGVSLTFNYAKFQEDKRTAYGGSIITLYNPVPFLQLSAELEQLRVNQRFDFGTAIVEDDYWSPALFLGLGYTSNFATIGVRYDVLYDDNRSIYAGAFMPFVRVYF